MAHGNIPANIESIVNNLDSITWEQAIFEAITNSLQANATNIDIKFISNTFDYNDTSKYIDSLLIVDNGDGFHKDNTESFQEYGSQYKRKQLKISAKGIGRFLYLKIFDKVHIESLDKKIDFSIDKDISVTTLNANTYDKTSVNFTSPKLQFVVDYEKLTQNIKEHFIAYFKLLKTKEIQISIFENSIKKFKVKSTEIPIFKSKLFKINNHDFNIDYVFNHDELTKTEGYYCAGNRVVLKNSNLDTNKKLKAFSDIHILYLISSPYLDETVYGTRDNFDIMPVRVNQQSTYGNTSWKNIQDEIKNQIRIIAHENNIDIDEISRLNLNKSIHEAPYLAHYLKTNEDGYSVKELIDGARNELENDKELLRKNVNIANDFNRLLSIVTQAELVEYVYDRQRIIKKLQDLTDDEVLEKEIHNLFMKQHTVDEQGNYKTNHLWLFDDRFMTYDKVFSEAQMNEMFPELIKNTKRPDILSLSVISNTYTKEDITDIVIIELKRPDENIDPAGAETQLLRYSRYINDANKKEKIRIWTYAFLKFNEETEFDLDNRSYNKIPVQGQYPIYYKYYENPNTIINFLDYRSMAQDANNRNKTFMKILNGEMLTIDESINRAESFE